MADRIAGFPTSVWSGVSTLRTDPLVDRGPDVQDWNRVCAELIAAQNQILRPKFPFTNGQGGSLVICAPVYIKSDGTIAKAAYTSVALSLWIGLVYDTSIANGDVGYVQTGGIFEATTAQWDTVTGGSGGLTPGAAYYVGAAGLLTATKTTTSTQVPTLVGIAHSATKLQLGARGAGIAL